MKAYLNIAWLALMLALGIVFPSLAQDVKAFKDSATALWQRLVETDREMAEISGRLDRLSVEIEGLKTGGRRASGIFGDMRLQSLLKDSQRISAELRQTDVVRREILDDIRDHKARWKTELNKASRKEEALLRDNSASASERRRAAHRLRDLEAEKLRLSAFKAEMPPPEVSPDLAANGANPEEARERLMAVRDFKRRLSRDAEVLRIELAEARRQRFVLREVADLLEEESFFSEQSFIRTGTARSRKEAEDATAARAAQNDKTDSPASAAETPEGSPDIVDSSAPVSEGVASTASEPAPLGEMETGVSTPEVAVPDTIPGTDPTGFAPSIDPGHSLPDIAAPAARTDLSVAIPEIAAPDMGKSLPSTSMEQVRGSLALWAAHFGKETESPRPSSEQMSWGSLGARIEFLERRLAETQRALRRFEEMARNLERSARQ